MAKVGCEQRDGILAFVEALYYNSAAIEELIGLMDWEQVFNAVWEEGY